MRLDVVDLGFRYSVHADPVIESLTYSFTPGTVTAVTGSSGRGKSTLLYLLGLMLTPSTGAVVVDGVDVSSQGDTARSALRGESISIVFQDALLDPARTTLANVLEGSVYCSERESMRERALELLDRFGVGHRAQHRPGEVSGGQAQRIALCRALLKRPAVVLADEPTGNLDAASADVVWNALLEIARVDGATVVVASHHPELLHSCDDRVDL